MTHIIEDRVRDTTTTAGVGTLALSGTPPTRYRSFGDACAPGDTIWIAIVHQTANEWEVTEATSDGGSALTRSVVLSSSNSGLLVNFSAGTKDVIAVHPADRIFPFEFTSAQKGLVPASGGGTTNFLRADGTFAVPPGTGGVPDGDKGDITVTAGGATWTIDNNVVSFAKFQDITTDRLLGRDTAASGDVEEISVGGGLEFTGSAGIQRSALTGDVTASAGSGATSIANDVVTYAKMQDVSAADRLLGRGNGGGAGDPQEITLGTNLSMSGTTLNATGGGGTPGGADTQVQFNDGGVFGGDSVFVWDKTNNRLTIGHTAALDVLGLGAFQVFGTTEAASRWTAGMFSADANGPELVLVKSRNAAIGSHTVVNNGDELGSITFAGSDGSAYQFGAIVSAKIDGTPGAVDLPTRLEFRTTADGGASSFERLRIDQAGRVGLSQFASGRLIDGLPARLDVAMNDLTGVEWGQRIAGVGANATGASLLFTKTRSTFIATNTIVQADDEIGALFFLGNNGTNYNRSAGITVEVDGTPGAADMPGRIRFHTTPDGSTTLSERLRIDQGGRIVAGGLAAQSVSGVTPRLQVNGATTGAADLGVFSWGLTDPFSPRLMLAKARGDTPGTHTAIQADDITGIVQFSGSDGTDFRATARIESAVDGTPSSNDMPGRLTLWTTPDGSATAVERMRIDSAGQVNIGWGGAALSGVQFSVAATSNTVMRLSRFAASASGATISVNKSRGAAPNDFTIVQADDTIGQFVFSAATGSAFQTAATIAAAVDGTPGANDIPGRLVFSTTPDADFNSVERMRIDSAGRVGIGGTPIASFGGFSPALQSLGTTAGGTANARFSANANPVNVILAKSRNAAVGSHTIVNDADGLGYVHFQGSDGTNFIQAASIGAEVDGTPGTNDMPGRLVFKTTLDGASSSTERMRIAGPGGGTYHHGETISIFQTSTPTIFTPVTATGGAAIQTFFDGNVSRAINNFVYGANAGGANIAAMKTRHTTDPTAHTIVANNDNMFGIYAYGSDGAAFRRAGRIAFEVDGTPAASSVPGRITFHTNAGSTDTTERLRITSAGNLYVGQTIDIPSVAGSPVFQFAANSATAPVAQLHGFNGGNLGPTLAFSYTRNATAGSHTIVQDGDQLGRIRWFASDGTNFVSAASIFAAVDGTPGTTDMPSRLVFGTSSDGAAFAAEKMRIDKDGHVVLSNGGSASLVVSGFTSRFQVVSSPASEFNTSFMTFSIGAAGPTVDFAKSRNTTIGSHTVLSDGDRMGRTTYYGSDGTGFIESARIEAAVDGTPGTNDMPGRLVFSTTADAAASVTERLRIKSDGTWSVNNNTHGIVWSDAGFDVLFGWDDSAATYKSLLLADIATEGAPAAGDFLLLYRAEGDLQKVNWSSLPGAGGGISNVVEDTTPELGGNLETNNNDIIMEQFSADNSFADFQFVKSRNASIGSHTVVQSGDPLGRIVFQGSDGDQFINGASIAAIVETTPGDNDMPTYLRFETTPDGSASLVERMRIKSDGTFSYVNNTVGAVYSDEALDVLWGWDDSASTYKNMTNAVIATEASPAAGDFLLLMGAEGDLRKVNWSSLPAGGSQTPWTSDIDTADFDLVTAGEALTIKEDDASTDTVRPILNLLRTSTGTPANGIGASLSFTVETAVGNNEIGATIEAVTTDVTSTSEDFDLVFKTMAAGATAAERLRIVSGGVNISNSAKLYTDGNYLCLQGGVAANDFKVAVGVIVSTITGLGLASDCALGFASTTFASGGATFDTQLSRTQAGLLRHEGITTQTNAVSPLLRLRHSTTGTAASGIGLSLQFEQDTGSDNYEIGATIEAVTTDVGSATEDFDVTINTMAAGAAAAERLRVGSGGINPSTRIIENEVILTDGANVTLDSSLGNTFKLTAGGNRTIDAPTNKPASGKVQKIVIAVEASGADRTITLATGSAGAFRFGTDITALTATTSGLVDYIGCVYNDADDRWDVVSYVKGF